MAADFNGDGKPDLAATKFNDDNVAVLLNTTTNQAPAAAADTYNTPEDTTLTVNAPGVLGNDSDPDGDTLSAVVASGPSHGSLTLNANGSFAYPPGRQLQRPRRLHLPRQRRHPHFQPGHGHHHRQHRQRSPRGHRGRRRDVRHR